MFTNHGTEIRQGGVEDKKTFGEAGWGMMDDPTYTIEILVGRVGNEPVLSKGQKVLSRVLTILWGRPP